MEELKMVKKTSDFEKYDKYAKKWDPYKTIACLHLWQFIES
jgi:3-methyladenine DNA glycosylase/8-oxoguanine DNA glycosylase